MATPDNVRENPDGGPVARERDPSSDEADLENEGFPPRTWCKHCGASACWRYEECKQEYRLEILQIIVDGLDLFCQDGMVREGAEDFVVNLNLMKKSMRDVLTDRVEKVNARNMKKEAVRRLYEEGVGSGFKPDALVDDAVPPTFEVSRSSKASRAKAYETFIRAVTGNSDVPDDELPEGLDEQLLHGSVLNRLRTAVDCWRNHGNQRLAPFEVKEYLALVPRVLWDRYPWAADVCQAIMLKSGACGYRCHYRPIYRKFSQEPDRVAGSAGFGTVSYTHLTLPTNREV